MNTDLSLSLSLLNLSLSFFQDNRENDNLFVSRFSRMRDIFDRSLKTANYEERDMQARVKVIFFQQRFLHIMFFAY